MEVMHFLEQEEDPQQANGAEAIVDENVQYESTASALEESQAWSDELWDSLIASRDRRIEELESTLAHEVSNNAIMTQNLVLASKGSRASTNKSEEDEQRRAKEASIKVRQLGRTLEDFAAEHRRSHEISYKLELRGRQLEELLSAANKRQIELEARVDGAESAARRVKVEAREDVSAAVSDASAARTGAFLQHDTATHIKVKLEAQATEHETEQAALRDQVEVLEDGLICTICLDAPKIVCLFPCSHVCMCEACAGAAWTASCSICRAPVTSQRRLFFA
jgi:hypothetical protein